MFTCLGLVLIGFGTQERPFEGWRRASPCREAQETQGSRGELFILIGPRLPSPVVSVA
jgi:hypothetical protein